MTWYGNDASKAWSSNDVVRTSFFSDVHLTSDKDVTPRQDVSLTSKVRDVRMT